MQETEKYMNAKQLADCAVERYDSEDEIFAFISGYLMAQKEIQMNLTSVFLKCRRNRINRNVKNLIRKDRAKRR